MTISRLMTESRALAAAFAFACAFASVTSAWAEPMIQVKPVVEIEPGKDVISLGDIVEMHGVSEEIARDIRGVRLADAPKPGEVRAFTDVGLNQILSSHLRGISGAYTLRVPSRVTVMKKMLRLKREDIENNLKEQFKLLCGSCEFEISGLSIPAIGDRIPSNSTWAIRTRPELPKGSFSYSLEVSHEDATRRLFWVTGTLTVRKSVPVAARALATGERVSAEDFVMRTKDVTFATDVAATTADFGASIVGRQIAAGEIIWKNHLRREMAVKMGDPVRVMVGNEAWQISTDGIAQGAGYVGDAIRVKIPRTQKVVSGLLKEKGLVEVQ
jgi:flagella basal body P-ring formation protein FlgA